MGKIGTNLLLWALLRKTSRVISDNDYFTISDLLRQDTVPPGPADDSRVGKGRVGYMIIE